MAEWWREQKGDVNGNTSLHFAAALGKYQLLFNSLIVGCEINAQNNFGWTPLMQAARNGESTCVKLLIDFGADVAKQNRFGICALSLAAASGNLNTVSLILKTYIQRGIPLYEIEKYFSPVFFAVLFNQIDILRYLHKYSYCLTKAVPLAGFTPVAVARILNHEEILEFFKRRGIMAASVQSPLFKTELGNSKSTPSTCRTYSLLSPNPHIPSEVPSVMLSSFNSFQTPTSSQFLSPLHRSLLQIKKRKSSNFRNSPIPVTPNLSPIDFVNVSANSRTSLNSISVGSVNSSHHMNSRVKLSFSSTSSTDSSFHTCLNFSRPGSPMKQRSYSYNVAVHPKPDEVALDDDVFLSFTNEPNNNNNHEFAELLRRHSLDSCISLFKKHEIDMELFLTLSNSDLEEIGVDWKKRDDVLEVIYKCNKMQGGNKHHKK